MVDCKHPGAIENGRVIIMNDTTTYNSAAEYHCIPHFQRMGPYMRKCLDDGQWSGEQPYCQRKFTHSIFSHIFFNSHKCLNSIFHNFYVILLFYSDKRSNK